MLARKAIDAFSVSASAAQRSPRPGPKRTPRACSGRRPSHRSRAQLQCQDPVAGDNRVTAPCFDERRYRSPSVLYPGIAGRDADHVLLRHLFGGRNLRAVQPLGFEQQLANLRDRCMSARIEPIGAAASPQAKTRSTADVHPRLKSAHPSINGAFFGEACRSPLFGPHSRRRTPSRPAARCRWAAHCPRPAPESGTKAPRAGWRSVHA